MKHFQNLLLCIALLWLSGCGYTLVGQGGLPKHIKTIAIPIFDNSTLEQGVEDVLTQAMIDAFVKGGKLRLVSEAEADALLTGTVKSYKANEAVSYNDKNEISGYKLTVIVDVKLQDLSNDEVLWDDEKSGSANFEGGPDVNPVKEQENEEDALRQLAQELAGQIFALAVQGF